MIDMLDPRLFAGATVAGGLVALVHATYTWPLGAAVAMFGGGAVIAFVAEGLVVNGGWLDHHIDPQIIGVPVYLLFAWPGVTYVAYRVALLGLDGWIAVGGTALLATTVDVFTDHYGAAAGYWTYTDAIPGPRYRGVPWWNYVGWAVVISLTVAITMPFLGSQ